jgi:hypothetical protein
MTDEPAIGLAVVAVIGLAWGLWLGMPGRDRPSAEDIERAMDTGGGRRRRSRKKRAVNPLAWVRRKTDPPPSQSRGPGRRGFKLESPDDR